MNAANAFDLDFKQVLDSLAMGVFTVDCDWNITFFNAEAERITGFRRDEALGRKCYDIFHTRCCNDKCYLQQAIRSGESRRRVRLSVLDKRNRAVPVEITAAVLRDASGRVVGGVESFLDVTARAALEKEARGAYALGDFLGRDPKILKICDMLRMAAASEAPILFLGETGTGKDLLARAAHNVSPRGKGPFVKINCAALPENLLESELFGYKKGAFTDARKDKPGLLEQADRGTLFLDEIGELPLSLQAKLLQAIEDKRFLPLGATVPRQVDVRVLAATNRDLARAAESGAFRGDLYYRLRVLEIRIPPLRERPGDVPLLLDHFVTVMSGRHGKRVTELSPEAARLLLAHAYPGNVRELMHIVEHAVILCRDGDIRPEHLPEALLTDSGRVLAAAPRPLGEREREYLLETLEAADWNIGRAAEAMGVNRTTVWRKMKKYGV